MPIDFSNLGNDPETLLSAFNELDQSPDAPAAPVATETKPEVKTEPESQPEAAKPKAETTQDSQQQADPEGVATKDGKHVIPYSVLKGERERANRAEQLAKEAQAELEAIRKSAGAKDGEGARTEPQKAELPDLDSLSNEELATLKEDFPTVYKALMATQAATRAVEERLAKPVQEIQAERERGVQESVQDAIDSIPKLAHIQATDKDTFDLAVKFDATLRGQPAWANKTLAERFEKVVEMVEAVNGQIQLPTSQKQPTQEELRAAAKALADNSAKKGGTTVPTSLSDFPSGEPPAQDEQDAMEKLTPLQLAEKFNRMTPDQLDAYFQGA